MTAPLIEAGDITESGNNTASSSWAVSYPNASAGDLLIFNLGWDDSTTTATVTAPAGPNSEVLSSIAGPVASNSTEVRGQSWFTIATGTWTASTLTFTPSASEQWTAAVIKVPAGEFDPADPMGAASTRASADTADTTVDSVGYAIGAADGGGTLVWFAIVDTVALGSLSSGWTSRVTRDRGAVAIGIATRNAATTASETTSSTDTWGISADSWASIAYVVRPPPALYYVVYPSAASEPSAAQIKAGQQQSGAAATAAGSETARTTTGEEVFAAAATGLTGGTPYKTSFVWTNGTNDSNVHTTATWYTETTASFTVTQAGNTLSAAAVIPSVATVSKTQDGNTIFADATIPIVATLSASQADNTLAATAEITENAVTADLAVTQAGNSITAIAVVPLYAEFTIQQAGNTLSSAAVTPLTAALSVSQASNSVSSTSVIPVVATYSAAQEDNTLTSSASIVGAVQADATLTQVGNTITSIAYIEVKAALSAVQESNTLTASSSMIVVGSLNVAQYDNLITADSVIPILAAAALGQDGNTISAFANITVTAEVNKAQDDNTVSATSVIPIVGNLSITNNDNLLFSDSYVGSGGALTTNVITWG